MLHWIITRALRQNSEMQSPACAAATLARIESINYVSVQLQTDLLATVQQHVSTHTPRRDETVEAVDFGETKLPVLQTTRGYGLLWHLALVAEKGEMALRSAARQMMRTLGASLGIQQAFALLESIEESQLLR